MRLTNNLPKKLIEIGEYKDLPVYVASRTPSFAKAVFYARKKAKYYELSVEEILEIELKW